MKAKNRKNKQDAFTITIAVSEEEKSSFAAIARELDVALNVLLLRLVRFFLDEKITWADLLKQDDVLPVYTKGSKKRTQRLRTKMAPELYAAFMRRIEELGTTEGIVLRRLISRYIAGKIERRDIW
jgi:hypothetical protein